MAQRIAFELNGETRTVEVAPDTPLLYDVLRNELGLSSAHFGCGLAECGACTVHVDGVPMRSCSLPVSSAAGTEILEVTAATSLLKPERQQQTIYYRNRCGFSDDPRALAALYD